MNIYTKERLKIMFITIAVSVVTFVAAWGIIFVTDYIMFSINKQMIFCKTSIQKTETGYVTIEQGFLYNAKLYDEENAHFYLLGKKIK